MTFCLVGKGAVKAVYEFIWPIANTVIPLSKKVFCIPTHIWKKGLLEREIDVCKQIQDNLNALHITPSHLAISYTKSPLSVRNKFTVICDRASGSLEKAILNPRLSLNQRLAYCEQACLGVGELRTANFVHQDIKLDNFLLFNQKTVKLNDFGTAKPQEKHAFSFHNSGNARYAPPENLMSYAGEVFSLGLVCIRILEEAILLNTSTKMLMKPLRRWYTIPLQFKKESGVVQYLIAHADATRHSRTLFTKYLQRIISWIRHLLGRPVYVDHTHQTVIYEYIDSLSTQLRDSNLTSSRQARRIGAFLKRMTASDPAVRPTAEQAASFFKHELSYGYRTYRYIVN